MLNGAPDPWSLGVSGTFSLGKTKKECIRCVLPRDRNLACALNDTVNNVSFWVVVTLLFLLAIFKIF